MGVLVQSREKRNRKKTFEFIANLFIVDYDVNLFIVDYMTLCLGGASLPTHNNAIWPLFNYLHIDTLGITAIDLLLSLHSCSLATLSH